MKRFLLSLCVAVASASGWAQIIAEEPAGAEAETASAPPAEADAPAAIRYGYCSRQQLLQGMPEYVKAMQQLNALREKYEKEAEYNESDFRRQYTEYLNGQKDFPQAILLKRQRDLQLSMENGIAFRMEADSLLKDAERDLLAPLNAHLDAAIRSVAMERGYDYVVNTDLGAFLYLDPQKSEDITAYVEQALQR